MQVLEKEKQIREDKLKQAKREHVERKGNFTDNLLKLRSEIADQKAIVSGQKQEHAGIQREKEELRQELVRCNNELKKLRKQSSDMDYSISNDNYGLIQERSNLQVARDKVAEAEQEREFSAAAPKSYRGEPPPSHPAQRQQPDYEQSGFDFGDDGSDDLHANFDDLMPESPDHRDNFSGGMSGFEQVNFDIPPDVDSSLFGENADKDPFGHGYDSDGGGDMLSQIASSAGNDAIAQSPFGQTSQDAWGAFDEPRDPSPDARARARHQSSQAAVPRLPIERLPPQYVPPIHSHASSNSTHITSPEYTPFGGDSPFKDNSDDEYQPFG